EPLCDFLGVARGLLEIVAEDLDVDGGGRAEVEDALHDAAREIELSYPGEAVFERAPEPLGRLHVREGSLALRHQIDLDVAGMRAGVRREERGASRGEPAVRQHRGVAGGLAVDEHPPR